MILRRYVKDKFKGISIGLDYPYRAIKIRKRFVIYKMSDGKIVEKMPYNKIGSVNEDNTIKRLYEINNIERKLDKGTIKEIDSEN